MTPFSNKNKIILQEDLALVNKWVEDSPSYWQRRAKALHPGSTGTVGVAHLQRRAKSLYLGSCTFL